MSRKRKLINPFWQPDEKKARVRAHSGLSELVDMPQSVMYWPCGCRRTHIKMWQTDTTDGKKCWSTYPANAQGVMPAPQIVPIDFYYSDGDHYAMPPMTWPTTVVAIPHSKIFRKPIVAGVLIDNAFVALHDQPALLEQVDECQTIYRPMRRALALEVLRDVLCVNVAELICTFV
jgi:hypothetical protein